MAAGAETLVLADPPVEVRLRRLASARRLTLRVSSADGSVHLTLPPHVRVAEARAFLMRQGDWLRSRLAVAPAGEAVTLGTLLPVEGVLLRLVPGSGRSVSVAAGELRIPGPPGRAGQKARVFLTALARQRLVPAADHYAGRLARAPGRVTLRDTASRWGSCSHRGDLMFSWRLIMAPPPVLDYVAAHEAAHLVEMNHSARFWAVVARICPDHARHRGWLKAEGAGLHRYRFD